jgi:hypothetical protein
MGAVPLIPPCSQARERAWRIGQEKQVTIYRYKKIVFIS